MNSTQSAEPSVMEMIVDMFGGMAVPAMCTSGVPSEFSGGSRRDATNTHGRDGHATDEEPS